MFPTFDSFRQVFAQITDNYSFMNIVNRGAAITLYDKVKWYKSANAQEFAKIPVTNLKKYNKLLELESSNNIITNKFVPEIRKKIEEKSYGMSELSDAESKCSCAKDLDIQSIAESVVSAKCDRLENLLLSISICNNNICKLVTSKSVADNRIDILENIANSNTLITNFLSNK